MNKTPRGLKISWCLKDWNFWGQSWGSLATSHERLLSNSMCQFDLSHVSLKRSLVLTNPFHWVCLILWQWHVKRALGGPENLGQELDEQALGYLLGTVKTNRVGDLSTKESVSWCNYHQFKFLEHKPLNATDCSSSVNQDLRQLGYCA